MTADFKSSNAQISSRQKTLGNLPKSVLGQLNGQPIVVAKLLLPLIEELDPALTSVLATLSLGKSGCTILSKDAIANVGLKQRRSMLLFSLS